MGSPTRNFYSNAFERQGFGDDVRAVQDLWLAGDREAARQRVPTAIGMGTNLLGPPEVVRERLRLYRDAGVTTLRTQLQGDPNVDLERQVRDLGQLLELVADVNRTEPKDNP
jgi:alkanesulfonate monooxygenase SsuD/methylene tetrahydromethanopterin reductase-like flavin-dependent oxidoreductase (luciferase family)